MIIISSLSIMIVLVLVATWTDFRQRRIPNWLTLTGVLTGVAFQSLEAGATGIGVAGFGIAVGLVMFLPLYAFGKMGGGDVKLMAMVGAFLGPEGVFWAALWSAMAGGVLAVIWILFELGLRSSFYRAIGSFAMIQLPGSEVLNVPEHSPLKSTMPYALAIATGSLVAAWQLEQR